MWMVVILLTRRPPGFRLSPATVPLRRRQRLVWYVAAARVRAGADGTRAAGIGWGLSGFSAEA